MSIFVCSLLKYYAGLSRHKQNEPQIGLDTWVSTRRENKGALFCMSLLHINSMMSVVILIFTKALTTNI